MRFNNDRTLVKMQVTMTKSDIVSVSVITWRRKVWYSLTSLSITSFTVTCAGAADPTAALPVNFPVERQTMN